METNVVWILLPGPGGVNPWSAVALSRPDVSGTSGRCCSIRRVVGMSRDGAHARR